LNNPEGALMAKNNHPVLVVVITSRCSVLCSLSALFPSLTPTRFDDLLLQKAQQKLMNGLYNIRVN
jgi:hypothetical protein